MPLPLSTACARTLRHVNKERSDEKRPQDPESAPSSRKLYKFFQKPTWMMQNMYPKSNQDCATQSRCTDGYNNLVQELDSNHKHCNCGTPQFLRAPTRAPVVAQQQAHDNHTKNCTCESPRSAAQCALCVPGSASSWMSTILLTTRSTTGFIRRLLELVLHVHRDVHEHQRPSSALPRRVPLGAVRTQVVPP